jgi:small subunit ribosomal protein S4
MARYAGPECRQCRRETMKLFLKGNKCMTDKCPIERRNYPPGQHTEGQRGKGSDYGKQLREKQKLRRMYGVLEKQFRNYYEAASRKRGVTGEMLLQMLERRLDNVIFRMGFAINRLASRQLVTHGHVRVNGRKVDIPSFEVKVGDRIEIREKSKALVPIQQAIETLPRRGGVPAWLEVNHEQRSGVFAKVPSKEEIGLPIQEQMIVELYSK